MGSFKEFTMGSLALLQSLRVNILGQASVKAIYGEPISAHEKTIIPVAKISYGYGAGAAQEGSAMPKLVGKEAGAELECAQFPVGVIDVSSQETRFIPITSRKKLGSCCQLLSEEN
jgi:uncharacterized spore protein YtfJ